MPPGLRRLAALLLLAGLHPASAQTVLNISVQGSDSVAPDRIVALLTAQNTAGDAATAQEGVNQAMAGALAAAREVAGLSATTGDYSVAQTAPPDGKPGTLYEASQDLQLSMPAANAASAPFAPPAAFTALVGRLQKRGLLLNELSGDLSEPGREAAERGAIDDAIRQIDSQAGEIAAALHAHVQRIQSLNVQLSTPGPIFHGPVMMLAAAPQVAPPKLTLQASVAAGIALTPLP